MLRPLVRIIACVCRLLVFAKGVAAGTVTGVVHNGTDGSLAAGVDVILIQLQGGMQPVGNTKSDAKGNYKFDNPAIGQQPMLIRAVYHGVMFHQPLTPGRNTVDVTVFEPSTDAKIMNMGSRVIVFQPNGSMLLVGEEYALQNQSQPPKAYFSAKGDFEFQIPEGTQVSQVSTWGPSRMPVVQATMDRGKGHYAIAYAFQPGENGVRLSYQVPYPSNHADVRLTSPYAVSRVMLVAAPTVQLSSPGFTSAGNEQGFNLYTRDSVPAGLPFDVSISGTAPPPSASSEGDQQGSDQDPEVNSRAGAATVQALPNRLDTIRWIIIGGFAGLFALGLLLLWRKPGGLAPQAAGAGDLPVPSAMSPGPRKRKVVPAAPAQAVATASTSPSTRAAVASAPAASGLPQVERDVQNSLDSLKDRLFRLELRRQAGTISEEEYARERASTEQILRELVRG